MKIRIEAPQKTVSTSADFIYFKCTHLVRIWIQQANFIADPDPRQSCCTWSRELVCVDSAGIPDTSSSFSSFSSSSYK
jgi:hypothetical protein